MQKLLKSFLITATCLILVGCGAEPESGSGQENETDQSVATEQETGKYFESIYDEDPELSPIWKETRRIVGKIFSFPGPFRVAQTLMPKGQPTITPSERKDLLSVEECKLPMNVESRVIRGFVKPGQPSYDYFKTRMHPAPDTVYQVVGISAKDAPASPGQTPSGDYGHFFDFLKDWTEQSSDVPSNVKFRVHNEYIDLPIKIKPFEVKHGQGNPKTEEFARQILQAVQPKIDFAGSDLVIVVVPAGTDGKVVEQAGLVFSNNNGPKDMVTVMSPAVTLENIDSMENPWFSTPMGWLHELHHIGFNFEDAQGDAHPDGRQRNLDGELGTGDWGLMSMSLTDKLAWQKWFSGFIGDSQVRCVDGQDTTVHWLSPSTVKTSNEKLLVVPLSGSEALIVESQRAAGLNYMLPQSSEGALVYYVNTAEMKQGYGYEVLGVKGKKITTDPFLLADWTLKSGESLKFKGIQIKVVESGDFGDVIQVEPSK